MKTITEATLVWCLPVCVQGDGHWGSRFICTWAAQVHGYAMAKFFLATSQLEPAIPYTCNIIVHIPNIYFKVMVLHVSHGVGTKPTGPMISGMFVQRVLSPVLTGCHPGWLYTETKMSSFWWKFHHWLHRKLSFWQLSVQPVMKISSKWRHFRFSVVPGLSCRQTCVLVVDWDGTVAMDLSRTFDRMPHGLLKVYMAWKCM